MHIVATKETWPGEKRAPLVPASVAKLVEAGYDVSIETGTGTNAGFLDTTYQEAGATIADDAGAIIRSGDIILGVRRPSPEQIAQHRLRSIHISFLDPFRERDTVDALANQGVTAISLEMIPRSTRAQKLDALSSQASLAGYVAVIVAANHLPRIFPMMMTPAGTLSPARVLIIGAGVAGLQAIATAHRLGARIEAFDTRPVVKEEVQSLGAKFLEIDIGDTGQTDQGYATALTPEQIAKQQQGMADAIARSDIVITTAQVFGRPAPRIVTADMVARMKPTSVVLDMAVETGGNVEVSEVNRIVDVNGVTVIGLANLPAVVATHASEMFSGNLYEFVNEFKDPEEANLNLAGDDDILKSCILTKDGQIVNEQIKDT